MKRYIPITVLLLGMLTAIPFFGVPVSAEESREITIINYNVAGLPRLFGNTSEDVPGNQQKIGEILAAGDYDIAAVQEDFGYHKSLLEGMAAYPYITRHTGGVPGGDGLNVYSRYPLYNETRTAWETAYGIIDNGADEMTPKGILYTVVELEDGVYLDLYNIHADAYGDAGSVEAREVQFRQLAEMLKSRETDRPVIVLGDYNTSMKYGNDSGLREELLEGCGLRDAWVEVCNDGNYDDFSAYERDTGLWDSIEKFLYKSGGGVELEVVSFSYTYITGEDGTSLSDHPAAVASFTYTKTADFQENTEELDAAGEGFWENIRHSITAFWNKCRVIAVDLYKIFTHFEELRGYLGF